MPIYPAAMSPLPSALTVPARWQPARVTAAVLCFVAAVLVVASSFLSLYSGELTIDAFDTEETLEVEVTPWAVEYSEESLNDAPGNEIPRTGYPMVFAAVALACAAAACWYAATPAAGRTAGRAAGTVTTASSTFLIGTVWTTAIVVSTGVDNIIVLGTTETGLETDASYLAGYWLLLTALLVSFVAAVLSLLPARQPAWYPQPPVNPYGMTPPYGSALPMTSPPIGQPLPFPSNTPAHAGAVDPLTGQPLSVVNPLTGLPAPPGPPAMPAPHGTPAEPLRRQPVGVPAGQPSAPGAVDPLTGLPVAQAPGGGAVDPVTGLPLGSGQPSPPVGLPAVQPPPQDATVAPVPGQPGGVPLAPVAVVDPLTGLPVAPGQASSPSDLSLVQPLPPDPTVNPVTGEPMVPRQPSPPGGFPGQPFAQSAAVDPVTGQPLAASPAGTPGGGPFGPSSGAAQASPGSPVPFTAEPTDQVNGSPAQDAEPPPIVLPDAPPLPEKPPGPAVPATEDPLAEPPRT